MSKSIPNQKALTQSVAKLLAKVPPLDALTVLNNVVGITLDRTSSSNPMVGDNLFIFNHYLETRRPTKIENDPELEAFILRLKACYPQKKIIEMCIEEFGRERAPSRTGLSRYLQILRKRRGKGKSNGRK
jgi:hypothetical protein